MPKIIKGLFKQFDGEAAAEALLTLSLSQKATVIATGAKAEDQIRIYLDEDCKIPEDTEVFGNDELKPEGTFYTFDLRDNRLHPLYSDEAWLKITGKSPVDITDLIQEGPTPELIVEPVPVIPARRALPSLRKPGTNYSGFVGGVIRPPASIAACALPPLQESTIFGRRAAFGVFRFTLPFRAIVSRASINIETPQLGNRVLVGLYDAEGSKVCSTSIDASNCNLATGELGGDVPLSAGEYSFAWTAATNGGLRVYGIGQNLGQYELCNAAGGAIVLGTASVPDGASELPDKLGPVTPCSSYVPILAWFKA